RAPQPVLEGAGDAGPARRPRDGQGNGPPKPAGGRAVGPDRHSEGHPGGLGGNGVDAVAVGPAPGSHGEGAGRGGGATIPQLERHVVLTLRKHRGQKVGDPPAGDPAVLAEGPGSDPAGHLVVDCRGVGPVVGHRGQHGIEDDGELPAPRGRPRRGLDGDDARCRQCSAVAGEDQPGTEDWPGGTGHWNPPRTPIRNTPPPGWASRWGVEIALSEPRSSMYGSTGPVASPACSAVNTSYPSAPSVNEASKVDSRWWLPKSSPPPARTARRKFR